METATGARRQPHNFQITTAGDDPVSPGGDQHDYACKILDGVLVDESFFAFIAHADLEDDWQDETTWRKANPNYGVSVNPDDMRALALKAKSMPAAAATFKQKRLNLWVSASAPWLSIEGWRAGQTTASGDDLVGQACYVGIDLASKLDLCAMVFVFPPTADRKTWRLLPFVWTPAETLRDRAHRDRAPYDVWAQQGWLRTTEGSRVDHNVLREVLRAERERFQIQQIGFDPWHAGTIIDQLVDADGFTREQVIEVPQTFAHMSNGSLAFEGAVLEGQVDAGGSPLLTWCASNAVVQRDGKDNIQPIKKRSRGRIDPIVAAIIGMSLAIRQLAAPDPNYCPVSSFG
jgi:phage terminase large subunit-like protein